MKTALATAFAQKGVTSINVEFQLALAKFQNNGGTYGVALAMLNAAYGKGSGGRIQDTGDGRCQSADAPPIHDGEVGQRPAADKVRRALPTSPSTSTGRGAPAPSAASRPGHARRGAIAIASVQATLAKSLFDTVVLPDGRKLREVRWSECPALAMKYRRLSRVLMAVHNAAIPPDVSATLDTVVNEKELEAIVASVEKFNEIA